MQHSGFARNIQGSNLVPEVFMILLGVELALHPSLMMESRRPTWLANWFLHVLHVEGVNL